MGDDRNTSHPSAAAALLNSGQDVQDYAWMLVYSRQSEVRFNIYLMKKYMRELYERTEIDKSLGELGNISKMEKSLGQLVDMTKSMLGQIRSLQPTVHKAVNPYPSLPMDSEHASMTVNQGAIRSVYLITSYFGIEEGSNAIYGVKFKHGGGLTHEPPVIGLVDRFCEGEKYDIFGMKAAHIFNRSKLYILTKSGGYIIDTNTMSRCSSFPPPLAYKSIPIVVSAYDKLYCLAIPSFLKPSLYLSFERYDPDMNVWEEMPSYPFYNQLLVTGYAVCYGIILFSLYVRSREENSEENFDVLAFHISRNQWRQVEVDTSVKYPPFQGRAVVVGKTIYSLQRNEFIAFSFRMDKGDDGSIVYALSQLFILKDLEIVRPPLPFDMESENLAYLGNHDFFHVKTGHCFDAAQYLCITTFQIVVGEGERDMIKIINSTVHSVDLEYSEYFDLVFCFMPECGDYEPIEDESVTSMNQPKRNHSG